MIILGIDTSCDDTCISLLEIRNWKLEILSNVVSSQVKIHAKYGGVYPFLAKREHQRNLPLVLKQALLGGNLLNSKFKIQNSKLQFKIQNLNEILNRKIDFIAVTTGPGLEPCLWQGINFAKDLAAKLKISIIPVNHIEAHILANFISENSKAEPSDSWARREKRTKFSATFKIQNSKLFPAVCLVVSGGHTQLILMRSIGKYQLIGETRDDAAGECLDKVARILGLGYPGGPIVAKMATKFKIQNSKFKIKLPRPMIYQRNYDFSFSGLKTAVLYQYQKSKIKNQKYKQAMCAEVQQAIIDVLIYKTLRAAKDYKVKSIILGGGVAANEELRKQFRVQSLKSKVKFLVPPEIFCTDNAAMVAITAYFHQEKATKNWQKIKADANLKI